MILLVEIELLWPSSKPKYIKNYLYYLYRYKHPGDWR